MSTAQIWRAVSSSPWRFFSLSPQLHWATWRRKRWWLPWTRMMGPTGACGAWGSYSVHVDPSAGDVSELDWALGKGRRTIGGLMLNSLVLAATSLGVEVLARGVGGVKRLWGIVNFLLALCLAITVLVTKLAQHTLLPNSHQEPLPPPAAVKAAALALFSVLGIPLAVTVFSFKF